MHHQHTELPPSKFQRKQKKHYKSRQDTSKQHYHNDKKQKGPLVHKKYEAQASPVRCKNVVIQNMLRDVQQESTNVKIPIILVILVACATRKKSLNTRGNQVPKQIN